MSDSHLDVSASGRHLIASHEVVIDNHLANSISLGFVDRHSDVSASDRHLDVSVSCRHLDVSASGRHLDVSASDRHLYEAPHTSPLT